MDTSNREKFHQNHQQELPPKAKERIRRGVISRASDGPDLIGTVGTAGDLYAEAGIGEQLVAVGTEDAQVVVLAEAGYPPAPGDDARVLVHCVEPRISEERNEASCRGAARDAARKAPCASRERAQARGCTG